jgi:hypothetical protein
MVTATATEAEVAMMTVMLAAGFDAEETVTAVELAKADAPCLR